MNPSLIPSFLPSSANDLRVNLTQQSAGSAASEGDEVKLECNIVAGAFTPSLFYAISWLYSSDDHPGLETLVKLDHTGLLTYPQVKGLGGLQERLRLSRPTPSSFCLHLHRSHVEDGGLYQCRIEQFHLDDKGQWQEKASESAGPVRVTVMVPGRTSTPNTSFYNVFISAFNESRVIFHVLVMLFEAFSRLFYKAGYSGVQFRIMQHFHFLPLSTQL